MAATATATRRACRTPSPSRSATTADRGRKRLAVAAGLALLPAALTAYLGFQSGGYFPTDTAVCAAVIAGLLALRVLLARDAFAGFGPGVLVAAGGLALLASWTRMSALWSDADARAAIEADRTVLYLVVLLLAATLPRNTARLRWIMRALALALLTLCVAGLLSRVAPDVVDVHEAGSRLGHPLTAPNALGLAAALALTWCFGLSADAAEPPWVRVLGAAAVPVAGATLLLTYSRSGIAVCALGVVLVVALGRSRAAVGALLAAGPPTAVAVAVTYGADLLVTADRSSPAALDQGDELAVVVALCAAGAAVLRGLLLTLDRRLTGWRPPVAAVVLAGAVGIGAVLTSAVALDERFTLADPQADAVAAEGGEVRARLTSLGSDIRTDYWSVALDGFTDKPLHGHGAGTYQLLWQRDRPTADDARDAHSVGLEMLAELGIVGFALLGAVLATIVVGLARRARGPDRAVHALALAGTIAWLVHSGLEWDWEMPAVTLWLFAVGGAVLAVPATRRQPPGMWPARVLVAAAAALVVAGSVQLALSQTRLERAVRALAAGDCRSATDAARDALFTLERPEAYEVLAACALRDGREAVAVAAAQRAVSADPHNWRLRYAEAVVRAATGRDPRPAAREALRRNPRHPLTREAVRRLGTVGPAFWRLSARDMLLPLDPPRTVSDVLQSAQDRP